MAPFDALYGRPCRSPACWWYTTDRIFLSADLVRETFEKVNLICKRLKSAHGRHKSHTDKRCSYLEFKVRDMVFVKVSPLRNVMRFGSMGKLAPIFVGPFTITTRIGKVTYIIDLSDKLARFHDVFHVSHPGKCLHDFTIVVEPDQLREEEVEHESLVRRSSIRILEHDIKRLHNKEVRLVKVQWVVDPKKCTCVFEERFKLLILFYLKVHFKYPIFDLSLVRVFSIIFR